MVITKLIKTKLPSGKTYQLTEHHLQDDNIKITEGKNAWYLKKYNMLGMLYYIASYPATMTLNEVVEKRFKII